MQLKKFSVLFIVVIFMFSYEDSQAQSKVTEGGACLLCAKELSVKDSKETTAISYIGPNNKKLIEALAIDEEYHFQFKVCNQSNKQYLSFYLKETGTLYAFDLKNDTFSQIAISGYQDSLEFSKDCDFIYTTHSSDSNSIVYKFNSNDLSEKTEAAKTQLQIDYGALSIAEDNSVMFTAKGEDQKNKFIVARDGKIISSIPISNDLIPSELGYFITSKDSINFKLKQKIYTYKNNQLTESIDIDLDPKYVYQEISENKDHRFLVRKPLNNYYNEIQVFDKTTNKLVDTFLGKNIKIDEKGNILYSKPIAGKESDLYTYNPDTKKHSSLVKTSVGDASIYDYDNGMLLILKDELTKSGFISNAKTSTNGELASVETLRPNEKNSKYSFGRGYALNTAKNLQIPYIIRQKVGVPLKGTIIYAHGGSPNHSGDYSRENDLFNQLEPLLEEGYAVVGISHHGSLILSLGNYMNLEPDQERHPRDYFKDESDDFMAIEVAVLANSKDKPVIWFGHSNGSGTLNAYLTQKKDKVKADCAISFSGLWDYRINSKSNNLKDFVYNVNKYNLSAEASIHDNNYGNTRLGKNTDPVQQPNYEAAKKRLQEHLSKGNDDAVVFYKEDNSDYEARNPIDHIQDIKIPVFAFSGSKDLIITPAEVRTLEREVQDKKLSNFQIKEYGESGHIISSGDSDYSKVQTDIQNFINTKCVKPKS